MLAFYGLQMPVWINDLRNRSGNIVNGQEDCGEQDAYPGAEDDNHCRLNEAYQRIHLILHFPLVEFGHSGEHVAKLARLLPHLHHLHNNPAYLGIIVQMMKVGEESGKFGYVLSTMAKFYEREVENEVDTLVGLIEPAMIIVLGAGVGILLTAVLLPIYNIAGSIS